MILFEMTINSLQKIIDELRALAKDAIELAMHGDYANGNTDEGGTSDEGWYMFATYMSDLKERAKKLDVKLP